MLNNDDYTDANKKALEHKAKASTREALELEALIEEVFGTLPRSHTIMNLIKIVARQQRQIETLEDDLEILKDIGNAR